MICLTGFEKTGSDWGFAVFKKSSCFCVAEFWVFLLEEKKGSLQVCLFSGC